MTCRKRTDGCSSLTGREIGGFVRMFRMLGLFAHLAMHEKRFPILNRAWVDLQRILQNPAADEFSVASWVFLDLPVTGDGKTVADVFAAEMAQYNADASAFVQVTRNSRYGVYVDDGGTRRTHRLVELVTRKRVTVRRGINVDPGELVWTRIIDWNGVKFMLGDSRGWPPAHRDAVTDMLLKRLVVPAWLTPGSPMVDAYERFMKLAGPYWLSMLYANNEADPVLEPLHYLSYARGPVPDLPVPPTA